MDDNTLNYLNEHDYCFFCKDEAECINEQLYCERYYQNLVK